MIALLLAIGTPLAFAMLIASWLFRTAAAPLWIKVAAPACAVAAACYAPFGLAEFLGYPAAVAERDLPERAEIVAFLPHDSEKTVDLWLAEGGEPRAYETVLSPGLKQALSKAREAMQRGERVSLARVRRKGEGKAAGGGARDGKGRSAFGDLFGIGDDSVIYTLETQPALPAK